MREHDIMHENGAYWVGRERHAYVVYRPSNSATHSVSDSAYTKTPDGLSLAKARCDYLAKRPQTYARFAGFLKTIPRKGEDQ